MASFAKSIRSLFGNDNQESSLSPSRPQFFEASSYEKQLTLLEASSLPPIRDEINMKNQHELLIKKLKLCSIICDFRLGQELNNMEEKQKIFNKTSMLHEINTYLKTTNTDWNTLEIVTALFNMVSKNLFRPIPDSYHIQHLMGVDHYIPITYTIPKWQHLEIVYQILNLTFSNKSINQLLITEYIKKYDFILHFVNLLNSLDKNERNYIQSVLETFYNEHGNLFEKELILHLVHYCLNFIHNNIGSAEGIKSILNVFNSMSIIDKEIYIKILMPLHKMDYKDFRIYEFVLWIYCKRIIEEDEHLSIILFKQLLQFWPITNPFKEQQFLKKIAIIIDFIDEDIWENISQTKQPKQFKLFKQLSYKILYCLQNSNHYKTICDILDIIETEEIQEFMDKYGGKDLWTRIYQSLYDIVNHFFYFETVNKCRETMEILREHDDLPMKYIDIYTKIDSGNYRVYPLPSSSSPSSSSSSTKRKQKYNKLTKKAHSTALYKKIQKQKQKEEKEEKARQKALEKAEKQRQKEQNKPIPSHSKNTFTRHRSNHISNGHITHQLAKEYVESPPSSPKFASINGNDNNNNNNNNATASNSPYFQRYMQLQKKKNASTANNNNNVVYNNKNNNSNNKDKNVPPPPSSNISSSNISSSNKVKVPPPPSSNNSSSSKVNAMKAMFENNGNANKNNNYNNNHNNHNNKNNNNNNYKIVPKNTSIQSPPNNPKLMFKKSQSAGNVINGNKTKPLPPSTAPPSKNGVNININQQNVISPSNKRSKSFWPSSKIADDRPQSSKGHDKKQWFTKSDSNKDLEKQKSKQQKQKEKEEKARQKALEKAEKQRQKDRDKAEKQKQKDLEKERKRKEKREKKEQKRLEKEMKRRRKNRPRKSVDIDRRSSSISNPMPPQRNTPQYNKYSQITSNNQNNHYLNTQYYSYSVPNPSSPFGHRPIPNTQIRTGKDQSRKHTDYDKSPILAFSYSPTATYDPPRVPLSSNANNGRNTSPFGNKKPIKSNQSQFGKAPFIPRHNKTNSQPIRPKTPPPPKKRLPPMANNNNHNNNYYNNNNSKQLAVAQPLGANHPLRRDKNGNKISKKANSMNFIPTNKIKPPPHSGNNKKLPPRPWPPR